MLKKHKNKIIATIIILAVLAGAWFWGGNYNSDRGSGNSGQAADDRVPINGVLPANGASDTINAAKPETETGLPDNETGTEDLQLPISEAQATESRNPLAPEPGDSGKTDEVTTRNSTEQSETPSPTVSEPTETSENPDHAPEQTPETSPAMALDPVTGLDRYQTSQVPEGRPAPVEPEDMVASDGSFTITLTVRCDTILDNMNLLNKEKHELIPEDGVIFAATTVTAYEGESVFNITQREMRRAGIHMTFRNTIIYNSAYIEAINNLYEFDVGELSGWMYKVNGWFPNYGCSRYLLQPGDMVEWHYTCDLGRDLGEYWLGAGWSQQDD